MAVESHIPFGSESGSSQDGDGFEPPKPRRKSRRERRAEHARASERMPAPHTIWTREDPNHLQPLNVGAPVVERAAAENDVTPPRDEQKPAKKAEHAPKLDRYERVAEAPKAAKPPVERRRGEASNPAPEIDKEQTPPTETAMPAPQVHEASARKGSQPESLAELLKLQELPKLNIHPRHFYTEPEVRQPNTTEVEHDILPSAHEEKQPTKPSANTEPEKPATDELSSMPNQNKVPGLQPESEPNPPVPSLEEVQRVPSRSDNETAKRDEVPRPAEAPSQPEQLSAGEQLQRIADETAKRAAELADKDNQREQPEEWRNLATAPEAAPEKKSATPETQSNESEADFRMDRADLLALGDSIRVDGVSTAEMFRAGRLDEDGLRRIVAEFLRGRDTQRVIAEEVLRVQMKFERDPQLRKTSVAKSSGVTKRAASQAKVQAKKVLDPKRAKQHADRLADRFVDSLDRMVEVAERNPSTGKTIGIGLVVVAYFVVLFLILKS